MATKSVLLFIFGFHTAVLGNCPDGWLRHRDMCYHFSHDTESFAGAMIMCKYMGGPLAEVVDLVENHYLGGVVDTLDHSYWIGATDIAEEGIWKWADSGKDVTIYPWAHGNPDNTSDNENCVVMDGDGLWHDRECNDNYHYICKMPDSGSAIIG